MQTKQIIYHFLYFAVTPLLISTIDFAAKLELSEVFAIAPPPPKKMSGLIWIQAVRRSSDVPDGVISIYVSGPELIVWLARDGLTEWFGPRSGSTKCRARSGSKPSDALVMSPMVLSPFMYLDLS